MSQAIDLPLTGLGLEMMFLGPTSVWHHRLCGPWGKLEASALFFKGNQGIDRPSSTKTTASLASLHFIIVSAMFFAYIVKYSHDAYLIILLLMIGFSLAGAETEIGEMFLYLDLNG